MSWDTFLVDAMEVLSEDRDRDYWRFSSWNAAGFSAQTRASLLCSNVVDCMELLLQPWFSCEGLYDSVVLSGARQRRANPPKLLPFFFEFVFRWQARLLSISR